jgi:deazaflavin-dependent oxidoreductase (nitroreductase family)
MNDKLAERLKLLANQRTLRLTHFGRKSRKQYQVTIWFLVDDDKIWLPSPGTRSQWPRNLDKNPVVEMRIGRETFSGDARRVTAPAERNRIFGLLQKKYWYALPFIWVTVFLKTLGVIARDSGPFQVTVNA